MKLGRLNHIGVATPSIADSIVFYRDVMGATKIHAPFERAAFFYAFSKSHCMALRNASDPGGGFPSSWSANH